MARSTGTLPRAAWLSLVGWTALATLLFIGLSITVTGIILHTIGRSLGPTGIGVAVTVAFLVGAPAIFYHLLRQRQLHLANQRLQQLASTDWLTACLNRRSFTSEVCDLLDHAKEGAFLVIDADNFKLVNDRFGHDHGDEALQLVARTIKSCIREGDLVGRLGGEEFGVFLLGARPETAMVVAERIRRAVERVPFAPDGIPHTLSVSVGVAPFDRPVSFRDLFRAADRRLYGAKHLGRNRVVTEDPVLAQPSAAA
ncbi:MAG TPA: GGDEF domain-containing protein [Devosia sp.]